MFHTYTDIIYTYFGLKLLDLDRYFYPSQNIKKEMPRGGVNLTCSELILDEPKQEGTLLGQGTLLEPGTLLEQGTLLEPGMSFFSPGSPCRGFGRDSGIIPLPEDPPF